MSASAGRGGNWISANYDKAGLLGVIVVVLASAGILLTKTGFEAGPSITGVGGNAGSASVVPVDGNSVGKVLQSLEKPVQAALEQRRLFVGPLRVACIAKGEPVAYDSMVCSFCSAKQPLGIDELDSDGDGLLDKWEKANGLNPLDPSDAFGDFDKDGFNNLEEYTSKTDPKDPASKPDAASKVRHVFIKVEPFKLRFLGVNKLPNGANSYQLNARTLDRTYFTTNGGAVEGWKVVGLETNVTKKSVLKLQQGERMLSLPLNDVITDDSFRARLVSLIERAEVDAKKGDTVKLAGVGYYVVDITQTGVVLRDPSTGRQYNVTAISNEEKIAVGQGAGGLNETVPQAGSNTGKP